MSQHPWLLPKPWRFDRRVTWNRNETIMTVHCVIFSCMLAILPLCFVSLTPSMNPRPSLMHWRLRRHLYCWLNSWDKWPHQVMKPRLQFLHLFWPLRRQILAFFRIIYKVVKWSRTVVTIAMNLQWDSVWHVSIYYWKDKGNSSLIYSWPYLKTALLVLILNKIFR